MTHHYVEDAALIRTAQAAVPGADDKAAIRAALERWLARQRTAPALVGVTRAAEILGVQPPHVTRLKEQGRMPDPIEIEGSRDAFVREEVEVLARELAAERRSRARRREEKEAVT